jgi:hypothetical protein
MLVPIKRPEAPFSKVLVSSPVVTGVLTLHVGVDQYGPPNLKDKPARKSLMVTLLPSSDELETVST